MKLKNLNALILNVKTGKEEEMSFPTKDLLDALPKDEKTAQPIREKLPRETVKNMLINCLASYNPEKQNMFAVFDLGQSLIKSEDNELEFPDKYMSVLEDALDKAIYQEREPIKMPDGTSKNASTGFYHWWSMVQVYRHLGIEPKFINKEK